MPGEIVYTGRPAVQAVQLSKGATLNLNPAAGHDYEIVSIYMKLVNDGTAATRTLALKITSVASGAGNILQHIFEVSATSGQTKTYQGPMVGGGGGADVYLDTRGLVVPGLGSLNAAESNFVAGDTWVINILYRDIPVNLLL